MHPHASSQQESAFSAKGLLGLVILFIHGWAMMLQAWTRAIGTCGPRYFGVQAVAGVMVAAVFPLFFPARYPERYYWFCMLTLGLFLLHRVVSTFKRRKGTTLHGYYVGIPWVWKWWPSMKLDRAIFLEGMMHMVAGIALMPVSETLGRFWIIGCFASVASQALIKERDKRRMEVMEDALIEQTSQAEEFQRYLRR